MTDGYVQLDFERRDRVGFDEAVLCGHKTTAHIIDILDRVEATQGRILLTRLDQPTFDQLPRRQQTQIDYDPISRTAFFGGPRKKLCKTQSVDVAVICAGTSDAVAAREAVRTLAFDGVGCVEIGDIGVAGLWRLMQARDNFIDCKIVICVAGMDAALPSVVGGLVSGAVIAVPTSTGYGASRNGETALSACLASCAPGVLVTNIDNGYGAACAAMRMLNSFARCDAEDRPESDQQDDTLKMRHPVI